ncbi:MAG: hypothetical protein ACQKBV_08025 [Puniceicoccales bacterium]
MADKKSKEAAAHPNWRPDFRITDALPDVKAVRTNFLVNFVALAAAVVFIGYVAFMEFQATAVANSIQEEDQKIADGTGQNRKFLKLSTEFEKLEPKLADVERFYSIHQPPLEILLALSSSRPETIALQTVALSVGKNNVGSSKRPKYVSQTTYTISGVLKGDSAEALEELGGYSQILQELDVFEDQLSSVDVSQPSRNQSLGLFEFTVVVKLKPVEL